MACVHTVIELMSTSSAELAARCVWRSTMREITGWSDSHRELVKYFAEPMVVGYIGGEFIIAATEVLHERVPGGTGVRLSTPEDCDLRFYSCGDAGLTTGGQLRIMITARGRFWSRSVYRAGRLSVLRWGRRSGSRAARDSYFLPAWRHAGGNAAGRGRKREASAVCTHLEPRGPPMLPATTLPAAVPACEDAAVCGAAAGYDAAAPAGRSAAARSPAVCGTSWRKHRKTPPRDGDAALAELRAM